MEQFKWIPFRYNFICYDWILFYINIWIYHSQCNRNRYSDVELHSHIHLLHSLYVLKFVYFHYIHYTHTCSLFYMISTFIWISSSLYLLFMLYFFLYAVYGPKIGNKWYSILKMIEYTFFENGKISVFWRWILLIWFAGVLKIHTIYCSRADINTRQPSPCAPPPFPFSKITGSAMH
jgi:hypothetical protein